MSSAERQSFVFYRSFAESLNELSNDDKLSMYSAIVGYALDRTEPQLTGFSKSLFVLIRPQLDANWKRYDNGCKGAEFGSSGGAPKGNKNAGKTTPKQPQNKGKTTPNDNDNDNDNVNNKENRATFVAPTLSEIEDYFITDKKLSKQEAEYRAIDFFEHYELKNWMYGKIKISNWKLAASKSLKWEHKNLPTQTQKSNEPYTINI